MPHFSPLFTKQNMPCSFDLSSYLRNLNQAQGNTAGSSGVAGWECPSAPAGIANGGREAEEEELVGALCVWLSGVDAGGGEAVVARLLGRDGRPAAAPAAPLLLLFCPGSLGNRHAVHGNSSNPHLRREGYTVQVNVNDYLDIYCPHYNASVPEGRMEQYILYMVNHEGYRTCNISQGFKRWECNRPHAPHSPIKFSEKFQRYSAFSLGYEFHAGHEYYYISTPTHNHRRACLRMKVFVCCASPSLSGEKAVPTLPQFTIGPEVKIEDLDNFNPEMPKLEKSISGTSPKREHLPLAVAAALFLMTLLAS
ncbi:ephrin-A3-like [Sceloporus undulatus]|uniref:ephrin-A3-like n=1 Tax=Sceloporus undulatus TaxID=8520 RepID=UPI001C4A972F|nr:ephrin-A3-like [Sceloporus undulatus]